MLINGEDGSCYAGDDLGFFKSVLSKTGSLAKKAVKVTAMPIVTAHQIALKPIGGIKGVATTALQTVVKPFAAGQPVQEVSTAPACGFFQKIVRAFGGSPNCQ